MADPNHPNRPPPPYSPPQQKQPLQGQHSDEYAPYPQFNQQADSQSWGTPVMGAPANPNSHPDNQYAASGGYSAPQQSQVSPGGSGRNQQSNFSSTQAPPSVPGQAPQSPYVQQQPGPTNTSSYKAAMDQFRAQVTDYSKKAQIVGQNVWSHLTTGQSVADTAFGRMSAGTQLLTKGGFEGVFKATFPADADETLKKTYACFLSTSTGPVGGTLYISSKKLAFCSDRPLAYAPSPGQQAFSFYKVILPLHQVKSVSPSVNQTKPAEKYIQVTTQDNFEFWFMGFVNYDKGVKNLQEAVASRGQSQPTGSDQQPYPPPQQQPFSPNQPQQQPYPPNQPSYNTTGTYPPNQYGMSNPPTNHQ